MLVWYWKGFQEQDFFVQKVTEVQLLQQRGVHVVEYTGILTAGSPGTEPET